MLSASAGTLVILSDGFGNVRDRLTLLMVLCFCFLLRLCTPDVVVFFSAADVLLLHAPDCDLMAMCDDSQSFYGAF